MVSEREQLRTIMATSVTELKAGNCPAAFKVCEIGLINSATRISNVNNVVNTVCVLFLSGESHIFISVMTHTLYGFSPILLTYSLCNLLF